MKNSKKNFKIVQTIATCPKKVKTSVNSEININIKGNETKKKYSNSLINNESINDISKKRYKYYKKLNSRKNDRLTWMT